MAERWAVNREVPVQLWSASPIGRVRTDGQSFAMKSTGAGRARQRRLA